MNPIERLLAALPDAKPSGNGWSACCPAHEDRRPSLSISEGDDGRALVRCHAGCAVDAICDALGLRIADLMPNALSPVSTSTQPTELEGNGGYRRRIQCQEFETAEAAVAALECMHGKRSALWTYRDVNGDPVGVIVRWDTGEGKDIRPVARRGNRWTIGGMPEPRHLYCLPDLADADRVYICEGEKAVDAAGAIGLTATTSAHGSQSPDKTDWSVLAGKECVILPDNDDAGEKYAERVAAMLEKLEPPPVVKIVELTGLPEGGDIVEWREARKESTADELLLEIEALADSTEPHVSERQSPRPICYQPFPIDCLPEPIRRFVIAGSKSIGCDMAFIALPLICCIGAILANRRSIQLKRTWHEPPIIWGATVGSSGSHKSPAISLATKVLERKENEEFEAYKKSYREYETAKLKYERELTHWKRKKNSEPPPWEPEEPVWRRTIIGDATIEAIANLLGSQPDALLMVRDELAGWLDSLAQYKGGKGSDTGHWLAMWNAAPLTVDRKTGDRKMIRIPRAAVSVIGGIQPAILRRAIGREHLKDGLCPRLLLVMPASNPVRWSDDSVDPRLEQEVRVVFDRLYELEPAADSGGNPTPYALKLSDDARQEWIAYYNRHREEQADLDEDLAAAWSKLEAYAARLALIVHVLRAISGEANESIIDDVSVRAGIQLSDWFGGEAKRVYNVLHESEQEEELRRLLNWIQRRGGEVTAREVQQGHRQYSTAQDAQTALDELAKTGHGNWLYAKPSPKGGRPTRVFRLFNISTTTRAAKRLEAEGLVDVGNVDTPAPQVNDDWGEL